MNTKALWSGSSRSIDIAYGVACTVSLQKGRPGPASCEVGNCGLEPLQSAQVKDMFLTGKNANKKKEMNPGPLQVA